MLVCLAVLVEVCKRESKNKMGERAQIRTFEENKRNSSQKNLYY